MAPYNQYGTYYDSAGSQSGQPQGYTYQGNTTGNPQYPSQTPSTYASNNYSDYASSYGQYGANASHQPQQQQQQQQQQASTKTSRGPGLNGLPSQSTARRPGKDTPQYDSSAWNYGASTYNVQTSRTQASASPIYAANAPSAVASFGRLSLPDQSQTASNTYPGSTPSYHQTTQPSASSSTSRSYQSAYSQAQPAGYSQSQSPQRYASPLQAVQAQQQQHSNMRQASRGSAKSSPSMDSHRQIQRQPTCSAEPAQTTVDPSQVYDMRAEQQRKAQIEDEKQRKLQAAKGAREAEEAARQKAQQEKERMARDAEDARKAKEADDARKAKDADNARKAKEVDDVRKTKAEDEAREQAALAEEAERTRRDQEDNRQSNTAATALQQLSSSFAPAASAPYESAQGTCMNTEEAEMRAMFEKMRQWNQKNPALLTKLWEEERRAYAPPPATASSTPTVAKPKPPPKAKPPTPKAKPPPKSRPGDPPPNSLNHFTAQVPNKPSTSIPAVGSASKPTSATLVSRAPAPSVPTAPRTAPMPTARQASTALTAPRPAPTLTEPHAAPASTTTRIPPTSTGALWPPDKKGSLAEAAALYLAALPQNRADARVVKKADILRILGEGTLSYVQLCQSLEEISAPFDRSGFARELLRAVPNGAKTSASTTTQNNSMLGVVKPKASNVPSKRGRPTNVQAATGRAPTVQYQSLSDAARDINSMGKVAPLPTTTCIQNAYRPISNHMSQAPGPVIQSRFQLQPLLPPPSESSGTRPEVRQKPPRPPANKEEAARKRTFSELIDLTGADSDDEGPPRKVQPVGQVQQGQLSGGLNQPVSFQQFMYQGRRPDKPLLPSGPLALASAEPARLVPTQPTVQLAPPPSPKTKGPSAESEQGDRLKGKMLVEPLMRDRVARKSTYDCRTIARDVLLAAGRHPDMRKLNGHLFPMLKMLSDHGGTIDGSGNKSDLSTIRWDIIDPGEPYTAEVIKSVAARPIDLTDELTEDADDKDDGERRGGGGARDKGQSVRASPEARGKTLTQNNTPRETTSTSTIKRQRSKKVQPRPVGRPRKHEALVYDSDHGLHDVLTTPVSRKQQSTPRRSINQTASNQSSPTMASGGAIGYSEFRKQVEYDADGNVIKKKGRPVGWRKSIHSREAQGLTPAKAGARPLDEAAPRRARKSKPKKVKRKPDGTSFEEPHYAVYACKWEECKAELHNLDTLKRHLLKVHGVKDADRDFECLWVGCKTRVDVDQHGKETPCPADEYSSFVDIKDWEKHVNKVHVQQVAWELGDGPNADFTPTSDAYLSDAYGRSVTPIITPGPPPAPPNPSEKKLNKTQRDALKVIRDVEAEIDEETRQVGVIVIDEGLDIARRPMRANTGESSTKNGWKHPDGIYREFRRPDDPDQPERAPAEEFGAGPFPLAGDEPPSWDAPLSGRGSQI